MAAIGSGSSPARWQSPPSLVLAIKVVYVLMVQDGSSMRLQSFKTALALLHKHAGLQQEDTSR